MGIRNKPESTEKPGINPGFLYGKMFKYSCISADIGV